MRLCTAIPSACALALVTVLPLSAQPTQRWSVQASGITVGLRGDAYEGLSNGYGGEVQLRHTPGLWSWGAGAQYSSHSVEIESKEHMTLRGLFIEPRRVFDVGSATFAPYLSARAAWLHQSATFDVGFVGERRVTDAPSLRTGGVALQQGGTAKVSASGFQANLGGGVLARLSPRVNLDLGLTFGVIRFSDATLTVNGTDAGTFTGSSGTGQNLVARAGLAIGLGKGPVKARPAPAKQAPQSRR